MSLITFINYIENDIWYQDDFLEASARVPEQLPEAYYLDEVLAGIYWFIAREEMFSIFFLTFWSTVLRHGAWLPIHTLIKLMDSTVSGASFLSFLTGGMLECSIAHRRSIAPCVCCTASLWLSTCDVCASAVVGLLTACQLSYKRIYIINSHLLIYVLYIIVILIIYIYQLTKSLFLKFTESYISTYWIYCMYFHCMYS